MKKLFTISLLTLMTIYSYSSMWQQPISYWYPPQHQVTKAPGHQAASKEFSYIKNIPSPGVVLSEVLNNNDSSKKLLEAIKGLTKNSSATLDFVKQRLVPQLKKGMLQKPTFTYEDLIDVIKNYRSNESKLLLEIFAEALIAHYRKVAYLWSAEANNFFTKYLFTGIRDPRTLLNFEDTQEMKDIIAELNTLHSIAQKHYPVYAYQLGARINALIHWRKVLLTEVFMAAVIYLRPDLVPKAASGVASYISSYAQQTGSYLAGLGAQAGNYLAGLAQSGYSTAYNTAANLGSSAYDAAGKLGLSAYNTTTNLGRSAYDAAADYTNRTGKYVQDLGSSLYDETKNYAVQKTLPGLANISDFSKIPSSAPSMQEVAQEKDIANMISNISKATN